MRSSIASPWDPRSPESRHSGDANGLLAGFRRFRIETDRPLDEFRQHRALEELYADLRQAFLADHLGGVRAGFLPRLVLVHVVEPDRLREQVNVVVRFGVGVCLEPADLAVALVEYGHDRIGAV